MTLEQNIKAILECNFLIARDEVIEAATKRIMEQIEKQNPFEDIKIEIDRKSKMHNDGDYYIKANDVLKILDININSKNSSSSNIDIESLISALEREEYAEECGGYVIPADTVYAILHKYIKENNDGK